MKLALTTSLIHYEFSSALRAAKLFQISPQSSTLLRTRNAKSHIASLALMAEILLPTSIAEIYPLTNSFCRALHSNTAAKTQSRLGTLHLIPVGLGEAPIDQWLPTQAQAQAGALKIYVAENAKVARAFLKLTPLAHLLQDITIHELNACCQPT